VTALAIAFDLLLASVFLILHLASKLDD